MTLIKNVVLHNSVTYTLDSLKGTGEEILVSAPKTI